jgi:hypothetical protein
MKIKNLLRILLLFILLGSIVNAEYLKENGRIYFVDNKDGTKQEVKDVDFKTFEIFEKDYNFAKDKNSVYYKNKKLNGISSDNFKYFDGGLSEGIFVDKKGIYILSENKIIQLDSKGVDLKSIQRIDNSNYFKDKNGVYYMDWEKFVKVKGADKNSFRIVTPWGYGQDKNKRYFYYPERDKKVLTR